MCHGASYVDERLMMMDADPDGEGANPRPYYYAIDRMYNVRGLADRDGPRAHWEFVRRAGRVVHP